MAVYKKDRMAEDIKREITAIMRELKDPRVTDTMLTVVRVEITGDLSFAKVFISSMKGIDAAKVATDVLTGAAGLFKREIGSRLRIRKAPEIKFIPDDSVEQSIELFKKLQTPGKEAADAD